MPARKTGWLRDLPDTRDHEFDRLGLASSDLPLEVAFPRVPKLRQRGSNSCVVHAIAWSKATLDAIAAWHRRRSEDPSYSVPLADFVAHVTFWSRLFLYWHARLLHHAEHQDDGTFLRLAIKAAQRWGAPDEALWPFELGVLGIGSKVNRQPTPAAIMGAHARRGPNGYYAIRDSGDALVLALKASLAAAADDARDGTRAGPVVFGMPVTQAFCDFTGSGTIGMSVQSGTWVGGHAVGLGGYRPSKLGGTEFAMPNWWDAWGDITRDGWAWVHEEVLRTLAMDIWLQTYPGAA